MASEYNQPEQYRGLEVGQTLADRPVGAYRAMVKRGGWSLCGYAGVPEKHTLARFSASAMPLRVHGGVTMAMAGDGILWPLGYWWYGWEYGHRGDAFVPSSEVVDHLLPGFLAFSRGKRWWTVDEVLAEAVDACQQLQVLAALVEQVGQCEAFRAWEW